eukprot:216863-Hanusia_phi.AAC.2
MEFGFPTSLTEPKQFFWNSSNKAVKEYLGQLHHGAYVNPQKDWSMVDFPKRALQCIEDQLVESYYTTAVEWAGTVQREVNHKDAYDHVRKHIGTESNPVQVHLKMYLNKDNKIDSWVTACRFCVPGMKYSDRIAVANSDFPKLKQFEFKPFEVKNTHYTLNVTFQLDPTWNY